jgi:hypothetical protein
MSESAPQRQQRARPASSARELRLEYLGFRDTDATREYLLRARVGDEQRDYVVGIEQSAFAARRVSLQDGPDVCFQHMCRELSEGVLAELGPLAISDAELASYRAAHTVAAKRRAQPAALPARTDADAASGPQRP